MCGICGYIGKSLNPELSFKITERLFEESSVRGMEASGFWGIGDKIIYHKEPIQSFFLVNRPIWQEAKTLNPSLLILHTRQPSGRTGSPFVNSNNHPFVNSNNTLAMIHNGKIDEYVFLKKKFEVKSYCDSEILLRILESQETVLEGLKLLISLTPLPHTALAIAVADISKTLWLYRNNHRPLWIIEIEELGQIFFCSTAEIWLNTIAFFPNLTYNLFELPEEQIWQFSEDLSFKKYSVNRTHKLQWELLESYKIINKEESFPLIREIDEKDNLKVFYPTVRNNEPLVDLCREIKSYLTYIEQASRFMEYNKLIGLETDLIDVKEKINRLFL